MNLNRAIIKKWKMHIYGFIILLVVQCISLPLLNIFLNEFVNEELVHKIVFGAILMVCLAIDFYFLLNRIIILRMILNKEPVKCKIEDIFFVAYRDENKTKYSPFPIVRSLENNELYLSYDRYSLVSFVTVFNYSDARNITGRVYKSDGTPVQLGDIVDMYIYKTIDIKVSVDPLNNVVKLNRKKIYFHHVNKRFNTKVFENITYFKGAICLEPYEGDTL